MTEQQDKVRDVLSKMQGRFGSESVMALGDSEAADITTYSTGSIGIDHATGVGGIPSGRITVLKGPFSSSKTTIAMHAIADCQSKGGVAAFLDFECSFDPVYAEKLGININDLIFSQPDSGEDGLQLCLELCETGSVDMVVLDSVAAMVPKAEIAGEVGDAHMALVARMLGQALRKTTPVAKKNKVALIFINQIRANPGVTFGSKEVSPGGRALDFFASLILDVRIPGREIDKSTGEVVASKGRCTVKKNKLAAPFKFAEYLVKFNVGISQLDEVMDYGVKLGMIHQGGSWFTYGEEKYQGKHNLAAYLTEHPEELQSLTEQVVLGLSELK